MQSGRNEIGFHLLAPEFVQNTCPCPETATQPPGVSLVRELLICLRAHQLFRTPHTAASVELRRSCRAKVEVFRPLVSAFILCQGFFVFEQAFVNSPRDVLPILSHNDHDKRTQDPEFTYFLIGGVEVSPQLVRGAA